MQLFKSSIRRQSAREPASLLKYNKWLASPNKAVLRRSHLQYNNMQYQLVSKTIELWLTNGLVSLFSWVTNKLHTCDKSSSDSSIGKRGYSAHTVKDNDIWMLIKMNMLGLMLLLLALILILIMFAILKISACGISSWLEVSAEHRDFFKS